MTCGAISTLSFAFIVAARSISDRTPKPCSAKIALTASTVSPSGRVTVVVMV